MELKIGNVVYYVSNHAQQRMESRGVSKLQLRECLRDIKQFLPNILRNDANIQKCLITLGQVIVYLSMLGVILVHRFESDV